MSVFAHSDAMLESLRELLAENSLLVLFLVLAIGFMIGRIRIGSFVFGSVAGVLAAGLLLGRLGFEGDPSIHTFAVVLFIFSVGYQAGPRLVRSLHHDSRCYLGIAVAVALTGLIVAWGMTRSFDLDEGTTAGVVAGGLTSTPILAAADLAVQSKSYVVADGSSVDEISGRTAAAFAITYVFGLLGLISIVRLLPGWLRIDLAAEALRLEQKEIDSTPTAGISPGDMVVRAIRVDTEALTGRPLRDLFDSTAFCFTALKIRRCQTLIRPDLDTELQLGDAVAVVGVLSQSSQDHVRGLAVGAPVSDRELLQFEPESVRIRVTNKDAAGRNLEGLMIPQRHASFVSGVERMGVSLDVTSSIRLERGDVLQVTGPSIGLELLGERLGHIERDAKEPGLRAFTAAIIFGLLLGAWSISVAGISIGLGSVVGLLAVGMLIGYLGSYFPAIGRVPAGARWVITELGLMLFMAGIGLRGGAILVETLLISGPALVVSGMAVTTTSLTFGFLYGRKVLGMNPVMLLGAISGAMSCSGALSVVNDKSASTIAGVGYASTNAFASVLLTVAGTLIVLL